MHAGGWCGWGIDCCVGVDDGDEDEGEDDGDSFVSPPALCV